MHRCAGLFKTLGANKNAPLPVRLFEVSDVVLLSDTAETGARNERRLAAAVCAKENTFETIHGFLNRVMDVLGVPAHVPGLGESRGVCPAMPFSALANPRRIIMVTFFRAERQIYGTGSQTTRAHKSAGAGDSHRR